MSEIKRKCLFTSLKVTGFCVGAGTTFASFQDSHFKQLRPQRQRERGDMQRKPKTFTAHDRREIVRRTARGADVR